MVDGSNESLYYLDEELDPDMRTGIPFHKSFEKVDVKQCLGQLRQFQIQFHLPIVEWTPIPIPQFELELQLQFPLNGTV